MLSKLPIKFIRLQLTVLMSLFGLLACEGKTGDRKGVFEIAGLDDIPNHKLIKACQLSGEAIPEMLEQLFCIRITDPLFEKFNSTSFAEQGFKQENILDRYLLREGWQRTSSAEVFRHDFEKIGHRAKPPYFLATYQKILSQDCKLTLIEHSSVFSNLFKLPVPYRNKNVYLETGTRDFQIKKYSYHPISMQFSDGCPEDLK